MLCYETTRFQKILFRETPVDETLVKETGLAQFRPFVGDVFGRAYSGETVKRQEHVSGLEVYEKMHDAISDLPEWAGLAERTRNNPFLSGIAASQVAQEMAALIPEETRVGDAQQEGRLVQTLEEMLAGLDPDGEEAGEIVQAMEAARSRKAEAEAASAAAANGLDSAMVRNSLRRAVQNAAGEVEAVVGGYSAFGCDPLAPQVEQQATLKTLADRMQKNPKLAEIAKLAGRLQRMMEGLKTEEVSKSPSEVVGVTVGQDIGRLLPSELGKLASTPSLFFKDLLENRLFQYQSKKQESKGRGPVVVCVDYSGSMTQGSRWVWAAAITLALYTEAKAEGRAFSFCCFNTKVVQSWRFSETGSLDVLLTILGSTPNGGTRLASGVDWAAGQVWEKRDADMIILSDGDDAMTEFEIGRVQAWKKESGSKVLSVRVAGNPHYTALSQISDRLWDVQEFASAARSLLAEVVKK